MKPSSSVAFTTTDTVERIRRYHRQSKHTPNAYAPGPGFLDWDAQPDPFRRYSGAPLIPLPLFTPEEVPSWAQIHQESCAPAPLTRAYLARFLELSLGLSAWKTTGAERWALRNNPSSGNLHPTEGYLLLWQAVDDQLPPGVYHYAPHEHALEQRALLNPHIAQQLADTLPKVPGALGFTSIVWREAWKYGARALRYCQHDLGHALGAAAYAAATVGWHLQVDSSVTDDMIRQCLGLEGGPGPSEQAAEVEEPDMLILISMESDLPALPENFWSRMTDGLSPWSGQPNILSPERVNWPEITAVLPAVSKHHSLPAWSPNDGPTAPEPTQRLTQRADTLIRQRRSAQRMVSGEGLSLVDFTTALARTLPSRENPPLAAFPFSPRIHLLIFVHQIEDLDLGIYVLNRHDDSFSPFRLACRRPELSWTPIDAAPLSLYQLAAPLDCRKLAGQLSCFQGIAAHGAFSLGMIGDMGATLREEGAWAYRRLFWEAGLIGQVLYLEAEASGMNATGIGCYFDDAVHDVLGLDPEGDWQSLYHFTVGKARIDTRLTTLSGYAHLPAERRL